MLSSTRSIVLSYRCRPILPKVRHAKLQGRFWEFLHIALGSLAEVDTQLVLAQEFGYLCAEDVEAVEPQIQALRMKLYSLINSLPDR